VVATPAARAWVDADEVRRVTGFPVLVDYRALGQPRRAPEPDAVAVCPATFTTVNKWAAGVADNHAMGVLCESLGMGIPIVVVPMRKSRSGIILPGSQASTGWRALALCSWTCAPAGWARPVLSGTGAEIAARFDPSWALDRLGPSAQKP
jgi:Flavoprotein